MHKITGKMILLSVLMIASLTIITPSICAQNAKSHYVLGSGDIIEVSVWNRPELKREMGIRTDGWISFPLAGEVQASGLTPQALSDQIREKLIRYLKDPIVSVIVVKSKSKKVLVLGEVKKPGMYPFEGGMTALEAISVAEGYNQHAQLKSILIIRNGLAEPVNPEFYLINLHNLIRNANTSENIVLEPLDIVYVPKNFIGNVGDFLDFFMSRIRPAAETYYLSTLAN